MAFPPAAPQGLTNDDLVAMRLRNAFSPQGVSNQLPNPTTPTAQTTGAITQPPMDISQRLMQLYQPQHQMLQQYQSQLANMPQPQQPSMARKIGSIIAGLGAGAGPAGQADGSMIGFRGNPQAAMETANTAAQMPYINQMQQFNQRLAPMAQGAQMEGQQNLAQRQFAETMVRDELMQQARNTQQQSVEGRNKYYEDRIGAMQQRYDDLGKQSDEKLKEMQREHDDRMQNFQDNLKRLEQANSNQNAINQARMDLLKEKNEHDARIADEKLQVAKSLAAIAADKVRLTAAPSHTTQTTTIAGKPGILGTSIGATAPQTRTVETTKTKPDTVGQSTTLTDPKTNQVHDISTWSQTDIQQARARGWK